MNKIKNYIGTEIEKFEILNQKRENNKTYLYCKCKKCGKEKWIAQGYVKRTKCCEFNHSSTEFKPLDLTNQTINNILILEKQNKEKEDLLYGNADVFVEKCFMLHFIELKTEKLKVAVVNEKYIEKKTSKSYKKLVIRITYMELIFR